MRIGYTTILANYLHRIKIVIRGTKTTQYLNGDYEGRTGRIVAAQKAPDGLEQTARVQFFDTDEERSFAVKYITPQEPKFSGEEVLVLDGKQKGMVLLVREKPDIDEMIAVSSRQFPVDFDYVPKKNMVALTEEAGCQSIIRFSSLHIVALYTIFLTQVGPTRCPQAKLALLPHRLSFTTD
jgi:transcription elongation factor SPT5